MRGLVLEKNSIKLLHDIETVRDENISLFSNFFFYFCGESFYFFRPLQICYLIRKTQFSKGPSKPRLHIERAWLFSVLT